MTSTSRINYSITQWLIVKIDPIKDNLFSKKPLSKKLGFQSNVTLMASWSFRQVVPQPKKRKKTVTKHSQTKRV